MVMKVSSYFSFNKVVPNFWPTKEHYTSKLVSSSKELTIKRFYFYIEFLCLVTGFSLWGSILSTGLVCIFYTTLVGYWFNCSIVLKISVLFIYYKDT